MTNKGVREDIKLAETKKYSFTKDGDLILKVVEVGDAGKYYCRRPSDGAIVYEILLDVHSKSPCLLECSVSISL